MNPEDQSIVLVFNSARFEHVTELIYAQLMAKDYTLDNAQLNMNYAMNAAYLYARNYDAGKSRHQTERCLNAEQTRQEGKDDEFSDTGSGDTD